MLNADPSRSSFPGSGVALGTCQRCHASAAGEMTFSSLNNVQGQPIRFRIDDSWRDERFLSVLKVDLPDLFAVGSGPGVAEAPHLKVPRRSDLGGRLWPGPRST